MSQPSYIKGQRVLTPLGAGTVECFETFIDNGMKAIQVEVDEGPDTWHPCRIVVNLDDGSRWAASTNTSPHPYMFRNEVCPMPKSVRAFNSGRGYGPRGQRIAWGIVEAGEVNRVAFADLDRMIDGEIILQPEQTTDAGLMAAYDKGGYLPSTGILVRDYLRELAGELL